MALTAAQVEVKFKSTGADKVKADARGVSGALGDVDKKSGGFLKGAMQGALGFFGGGILDRGVSGLMDLGGGFIFANASAEDMQVQMEIATGSTEKATKVLDTMKQFAKSSPFEFPELANSARQLEDFGMDSEKWIKIIGNTSAATGKSIDQTTQAVMDAQTGEFERLKEYGIKAIEENGKTYLQYVNKQGETVRKEIDRNNPEIINAQLEAIWNDKYEGAMDKFANTFTGKWATLKDNIHMAMQDASKPIFELAKKGLTFANDFFDGFNNSMEAGLGITESILNGVGNAVIGAFGPEVWARIEGPIRSVVTTIVSAFSTLASLFSTVAGIVGGALAAAFSFLARNMDLVVGAAKGIGALVAGFLALSAATGIISMVGAALALLLSPITLLIAAAAALGIAYQTNFLGFGDAVRRVAKEFKNFFDGFKRGLKLFDGNPLSKLFSGISQGLRSIMGEDTPGWLVTVANGFDRLAQVVQFALNVFNNLRAAGLNPVQAALQTLATIFPGLSGVVQEFYSYLVNLKDAFVALAQGDFGEAFSKFGEAAKDAVQTIIEVFKAIPWGDIWDGIQDAWDAIPWREMGSRAKEWLLSQLRDAGGASGVFQWLSDAVMDALQNISDIAMDGLRLAWDAISDIDWGQFIPDLSWTDIVSKVTNLASWLADKIGEMPWLDIVSKVVGLGMYIANKISDMPWLDIVSKVVGLGMYIANKISDMPWLDIVSKVVGLGMYIANKIGDMPWGELVSKVVDLGMYIANKIGDMPWLELVSKVIDLGVYIANKITSLPWKDVLVGTFDVLTGVAKGVVNLPWKEFVTGTFKASEGIKAGVKSLPWGDFIDGAFNAATGIAKGVVGLPWDAFIDGAFNAATGIAKGVIDLPWAAFIDGAFNAATGIAKGVVDLPWKDFIQGVINLTSLVNGSMIVDTIPWPSIPEFSWPSISAQDIVRFVFGGSKDTGNFENPDGVEDNPSSPFNPGGDDSGDISAPMLGSGNLTERLGIGGLGSSIAQVLSDVRSQIDNGLSAIRTEVVEPRTMEWPPAFQTALAPMGAGAAAVFGGLNAVVSTNMGMASAAVLTGTGAMLGAAVTNFPAMSAVSNSNFVSMAATGISQTASMAASVGAQAAGMASVVGAQAANMASRAVSQAASMASGAISQASSMASSVSSHASNMASNAVSRVSGMASDVGARMLGMKIGAVASAQQTGTGIANALGNGAANAVSRLGAAVSMAAGVISSYGGSAIGAAGALGRNIGAALASGLASMAGAVAASAAQLVNAANAAIAAKAMIASPSKLFMKLGRFLGQGFGLGIEQMKDFVHRITESLVSQPTSDIESSMRDFTNGLPSVRRDPTHAAAAARPLDWEHGRKTAPNVFLVVSGEVLGEIFDAVEGFKVLTSPSEFEAVVGS